MGEWTVGRNCDTTVIRTSGPDSSSGGGWGPSATISPVGWG